MRDRQWNKFLSFMGKMFCITMTKKNRNNDQIETSTVIDLALENWSHYMIVCVICVKCMNFLFLSDKRNNMIFSIDSRHTIDNISMKLIGKKAKKLMRKWDSIYLPYICDKFKKRMFIFFNDEINSAEGERERESDSQNGIHKKHVCKRLRVFEGRRL